MKTKWLLLLFLPLWSYGKELELKTTIREVTVFQAGAQVKRTGFTSVPAGEYEIKVKDATPLLKKESLQVKAEGDITILSVNHQSKYTDEELNKAKNRELEGKKKEYERKLEELVARFSILQAEENIIGNLQYVSTTTQGVSVEQVVKAQEMLRTKMNLIITEQLTVKRQMDELRDNIRETLQQIVALNMPRQSVNHEIVIKVLAKEETRADFSISYVVPNARWFPSYDIRVKNIGEPMQIEYKANVIQNSGEDWTKVKLKLSTGDPSQSSNKPLIQPWYINLNQNYVNPIPQSNFYKYTDARYVKVKGAVYSQKNGEPLVGASVTVNGTNVATITDNEGKFQMTLPDNAAHLLVSYVGFQTQTVAITSGDLIIFMNESQKAVNEMVMVDKRPEVTFTPNLNGLVHHDLGATSVNYAASGATSATYFSTDAISLNSVVEISQSRKTRGKSSSYVVSQQPQVTPQLNIVSTEFVIAEAYTIPSDQQSYAVQIQTINTPAKYQFYCAPRLDKDVFLTAQITDWEQHNLLEGQANVFFEGTFIGNTLLDTKFLTDTLNISLGRDKVVKVERKKSKEFNKKQFIGGDQIASRYWDITVRNGKAQNIDIIIEDQFPLAATSNVEVRREEKSGGELNEQTGVVTWKFEIAPGQNKEMKLRYSVKFPKGNFIGLD